MAYIDNVQIQVAARIKELMRENSLTQVALAEKVGIRQNTISAWLLGKKEPSIRSMWLLADYFNKRAEHKEHVAACGLFQRGHRLSRGQKRLLMYRFCALIFTHYCILGRQVV